MPILHVRVPEGVAEYVEEWADAVNAPVEDIAGDCVVRVVEGDGEWDGKTLRNDVDPRSDGSDDADDLSGLAGLRAKVPPEWCIDFEVPKEPADAHRAHQTDPLFATAVAVVARYEAGEEGRVDEDDVDAVLHGKAGRRHGIPVSLLSGVGKDPEEVADLISKQLATASTIGDGGPF